MINKLAIYEPFPLIIEFAPVTVITADIYMNPGIVGDLIMACRTTKSPDRWAIFLQDGSILTNDMSIAERIETADFQDVGLIGFNLQMHGSAIYNQVIEAIRMRQKQLIIITFDINVWNAVRAAVKFGYVTNADVRATLITRKGAEEVPLDSKGTPVNTPPPGFFDAVMLQELELV